MKRSPRQREFRSKSRFAFLESFPCIVSTAYIEPSRRRYRRSRWVRRWMGRWRSTESSLLRCVLCLGLGLVVGGEADEALVGVCRVW